MVNSYIRAFDLNAIMKFKVLSLIIIPSLLLHLGCNHRPPKTLDEIPIEMRPDWQGIAINELPVKFGQILSFKKDSNVINAIVLDFDKDEGGVWIGLCFIDQANLFGRQIPSGWINTKCLDLLDLEYLNIEGLKQYHIINQVKIDNNKVGIGSFTPVSSLDELVHEYNKGVEQRKKKQTPCNEGLTDQKTVRECYFDIRKIKLQ